MKKNNNTVIKVIQVVLWIALVGVFFCIAFMEGRWQVYAFLGITMALICLYSYKKYPTPKRLKGLSVACGSAFGTLLILYLIS